MIWKTITSKHFGSKLGQNTQKLFCGNYVSPPAISKYLSKDFNTHLNDMLSKVSEKSQETILMGDLNMNFLKQDNKEFKAILNIFGFKQMVDKPTRISESTETLIDIIVTNNPAI